MEFKIPFFSKKIQNKSASIQGVKNNYPTNFLPFSSISNQNKADNLILLYNVVPEVNSIITYISQVAANVPLLHVKKQSNGKNKEIKNSPIIELLNKPNEFQNGKNLKINSFSYFFVTGNIYLNRLNPIGFQNPSKIYCLPANRIYPITLKGSQPYGVLPSGVDHRSNEIVNYNWDLESRFITIDKDAIIHIKDSSLDSWVVGTSRLSAALESIESLRGLNDTLNTILSKGGALGFVKKNKKPNEIDSLIDPIEKTRIENHFFSYGVGKSKQPYFFTEHDISFQRILSQLSDFMPIEIKDSEFETLCKVLGGFPSVLLKSSDTTFTNLKTAQKILYTNIIMPLLDNYCESLTNSLLMPESDEKIIADYSNIECLQEDIKLKAEGQKVNDDLWINRYNNNLCTLNEMLTALEMPTQPEGNKYKKDEVNAGSVGEVESQQSQTIQ